MRDSIQGEIKETGNDEYVSINGNSYKVAKSYRNAIFYSGAKSLLLGDIALFCLDGEGKIAGIIGDALHNTIYGFLVEVSKDKGISDKITFRIFTEYGTWIEIKNAKNLTIDGEKADTQEKITDKLKANPQDTKITSQLIGYVLNGNNELLSVDTSNLGNNEDWEASLRKGICYDKNVNDVTGAPIRYYSAYMSFSGISAVSNETKVFVIPVKTNKNDIITDKKNNYLATTPAYFKNNSDYAPLENYNMRDGKLSDIVVYYKVEKTDISTTQGMFLFDKYSLAADGDGNQVLKLYGMVNGIMTTAICTEDVQFIDRARQNVTREDALAKLTKGCVIRLSDSVNPSGVQILFDVKDKAQTALPVTTAVNSAGQLITVNPTVSYYEYGANTGHTREFRVAYGKVYSKKDNYIAVSYHDDLSLVREFNEDGSYNYDYLNFTETHTIKNIKVMIYDEELNIIRVGTPADIQAYKNTHDSFAASRLLFQSRYGAVQAIIIYKFKT